MEIPHDGIGIDDRTLEWFWSYLSGRPLGLKINHGPSQSGPYSRVRDCDIYAKFFSYAK